MKTHPLNVSYLVIGLVYLGIAGSWALHQTGVIAATDVEWLLPLTLVAAGAVGLVAFVAKGVVGGHRGTDSPGPGYGGDYDSDQGQDYGQDYGYDYAGTYDYQCPEPTTERVDPANQLDTQIGNQQGETR